MRSPIAWALVLAALVIHSVKALREALSSSSGGRPWTLRALVTGAGVGALGFVLLHAAQLRGVALTPAIDGAAVQTKMAADLSSTTGGLPLYALAYLVGAACASFWVFGELALTARAKMARARPALRNIATAGLIGCAVVLWACFANVVIYQASGAAIIGGSASTDIPGRCP
jgi:hypothetical protein